MGCINSKNDLQQEQTNLNRTQDKYRVYACRISAESGTIQSGYLELSPKELVFSPEVGDTIRWALQHLRRYGCTGDVFSFEAGRRCMTGPGIYTFRCHNAEDMHQLFQSYINTVAKNDENAPMICSEFRTSFDLTSSNNHDVYLEPTSGTSSVLYNRTNLTRDSAHSSPGSSNLNSPSSFQGAHFTNEVIHLNHQSEKHIYPNRNIYQEFPIKPNEFNNNIPTKIKLQDVPPQEPAPIVQNIEVDSLLPRKFFPIHEEQHMYENVNGIENSASLERCYENFSSIDLPTLLNERPSTMENGAVVNYITLDLVQSPTSADSFSLKLKSVQPEPPSTYNVQNKKNFNNERKAKEHQGNNNLYSTVVPELLSNTVSVTNESQSSSMGYSTIDFIKTCALIKSVPLCEADCQESRLTRHSTCVLKTSSLSD